MKTENLNILNRIKPSIEWIINSEIEAIYEEYNKLKGETSNYNRKLHQLEDEIKYKDRTINKLQKMNDEMRKWINYMKEDWINVDIISDSDSRDDGQWWGWWYYVEFLKYKDQQREIFYEN